MANRTEYQQQYYIKKKAKRQAYFRKKYLEERKERLTYAKKQYILNRVNILAKLAAFTTTYRGHAEAIYKAIKKYAKKWTVPICSWIELRDWTEKDNPAYDALYETWKDAGFTKFDAPVLMRRVKKLGYVPSNLEWKRRGDYSWWSEDRDVRDEVEKNLDQQQRERNKSSKEWQKKVREEWKKKKKANK